MLEEITQVIFGLPGGRITAALALFVIFCAGFYAVYKALFFLLRKAAERTRIDFGDAMLGRMADPVRFFVLSTGVFLALSYTYPEISIGSAGLASLYTLMLMLNGVFALDRFLSTALDWYKKELGHKTDSKMDNELVLIVKKAARIVVYTLTLLVVLGNLGIEITPFLAGLGIASLAVALALQDSLGNFFAGMNIAVDRPLKKGDFITIDSGAEGIVEEIGWRSTKMTTPQNNLVIIPNTKLAQSIITNYSRPDETVKHGGTVLVPYDEDVERVSEAIKRAIGEAAAKSANLIRNFKPVVYLESLGDSSLNFRFTYAVKSYFVRAAAQDEVNRAIFRKFWKERIKIHFSTKTVHSHQAKSK